MSMAEPITVLLPQPAPDDDFHGPEFSRFYGNAENKKKCILCTACGRELLLSMRSKIFKHPALEVIVCKICFDFYHAGKFTQDEDGMDEHCKWCGEGGNLIMCDFCTHSFCNYCIKRNFSSEVFTQIRDAPQWQCFVCDKSQILDKILQCKDVMKKVDTPVEPQVMVTENSQESRDFNTLVENNKCLDEIIGPMETHLSPSNVNMNTNQTNEQMKKVDPIKIRKEKENYIVHRSASCSCDEKSPVKHESRSLSDPESSRQSPCKHSYVKIENIDDKPFFSNLNDISKQDEPMDEENNNGAESINELKNNGTDDIEEGLSSEQHNDPTVTIHSCPTTQLDSNIEDDNSTLKKDQNSAINVPSPSSLPKLRKNVGKRTKPVKNVIRQNSNDANISETRNDVTKNPSKQSTSTFKSKMEEAEECLARLARIIKEIAADEISSIGHKVSRSSSLSQYSKFRSTSKLLKKVKSASSKLIRIEHDLRAHKTKLRKYRSSEDSGNLDSSSDDDSMNNEMNKRKARKKTIGVGSETTENDETPEKMETDRSVEQEIFEENLNESSGIDPNEENNQPSTFNQPSTSTETSMLMKNPKIVLTKLTENDILKFHKKVDNNVDDSTTDLDTDSSKNIMRPRVNFNTLTATSIGSDSESNPRPRVNFSLKQKIVKSGKLRNMQILRDKELKAERKKKKLQLTDDDNDSDSDYQVEDEDFFSDSEYDEDKVDLKGDDDNEIAMHLLLQKMQEEYDSPDSDVDKLLKENGDIDTKDSNSSEVHETGYNEKINSKTDEVKEKVKKHNGYKHPLLAKKWKDGSDENDENPKTGNKVNSDASMNTTDKKRKASHESVSSSKKPRRKLEMAENSDPNLTTDSEPDISRKTRSKQNRKCKRLLSDSDSNSPKPIIIDSGKSSDSLSDKDDSTDTDEEITDIKKKFHKRRRRLIKQSESDGDPKVVDENTTGSSQKTGRKNIRKILDDDEVSQSTQQASLEEAQRRKRLKKDREGSKEEEEVTVIDEESQSPVKKLVTVSLTLSKQPHVEVHRQIVHKLKPHQVQGIQFLWDNIIEKVKDANSKRGSGCILAHCMGLGKSLQTVAFLHTVLMSKHLPNLRTALVLCPFGTVNNWVAEFTKWVPNSNKDYEWNAKLKRWIRSVDYEHKFQKLVVSDLHSVKTDQERIAKLHRWKTEGGILVVGYGLFRTLLNDNKRKTSEVFVESLCKPGPDILVCDEGHILKNAMSKIANMVQQVHTKRRIVLTGTPLQNNMVEYHCMVSIVKPKLLGTIKEFKNRFMNPIENGQHVDSTESDVKLMKKRAHVLHELLAGCLQRKDYTCLRAHLAPKYEYVLSVRLSDLQIRMYKHYLTLHSSNDAKLRKGGIFKDYNRLTLLICHPRCLVMSTDKKDIKDNQDDLRKFINDEEEGAESEEEDDSSDNSVIMVSDDEIPSSQEIKPKTLEDIHALSGAKLRLFIESKSGKKPETRNRKKLVTLATKYLDINFCKTAEFEQSLKIKSIQELKAMIAEHGESIKGCTEKSDLISLLKRVILNENQDEEEWYVKFMPTQEKLAHSISHSGKIMLMLQILQLSTEVGDKVVIFSQSLLSLDLIEEVLKSETSDVSKGLKSDSGPYSKWLKYKDYYRIDGSTPANLRDSWISKFNNKNNTRGRLFLISTRAGGIGINLIGANRAIVFDASWNPSHDIQSIFRIYRFGQTKPCYVYRFIAQGTMEEKIYERQIMKQSLAFRVVDEQQILRHFSAADVNELYKFNPAPKPEKSNDEKDNVPKFAPPKDALLAAILKKSELVVTYHDHDSLLDHQVSEELTEAERRAAWEEYDNEQQKPVDSSTNPMFESFKVFSPHHLTHFSENANKVLSLIEKKMVQLSKNSFESILVEIQMKNRTFKPETVSKHATQKKLDDHILLRRLTALKKLVTSYQYESKRCLAQKRSIAPPPRPTSSSQPRSFLNPVSSANPQINMNGYVPRANAPRRFTPNTIPASTSRQSTPTTSFSRFTPPSMNTTNMPRHTRYTVPPPRPTVPPKWRMQGNSTYTVPTTAQTRYTNPNRPRYRPNYSNAQQNYRPSSNVRNAQNFKPRYTVLNPRR
uniref:transcriptional regulator ATRX homolog n=1 Tax=Styela clava TaxID=7725 RepID=UPI00193A2D4B|nr:transcriptional regulator ATRX homolog [Styela clava]